jgi:hypothetical protein
MTRSREGIRGPAGCHSRRGLRAAAAASHRAEHEQPDEQSKRMHQVPRLRAAISHITVDRNPGGVMSGSRRLMTAISRSWMSSRRFLVGAALGCAFVAWIFIGRRRAARRRRYVARDRSVCRCRMRSEQLEGDQIAGRVLHPRAWARAWTGQAPCSLGPRRRDPHLAHKSGHSLILKLKPTGGAGPRRFITTNATNPDEVVAGESDVTGCVRLEKCSSPRLATSSLHRVREPRHQGEARTTSRDEHAARGWGPRWLDERHSGIGRI